MISTQGESASRKKAWTVEEIANFTSMMDKPIYRAIAAIAFQSGLELGDILALKYRDIKEEFEKGVTPLCLDLSRMKTDVPYLTFIGKWALSMLKQHLKGKKLKSQDKLFKIAARVVDSYFLRLAQKFVGSYEGFNPCRIHSLRTAFRTFLSDHQVDPLYIEFWIGHKVPEQQRVYISKTRESWRQTYHEQAEPWLTPPKHRR